MSFKSNAGKQAVEAGPEQCQMIDASGRRDVACLEPYVGKVPESGHVRVCAPCAVQMEREEFIVSYRDETRFVLVHPEMGIYLGNAMGLAFWSKLDPVGQMHAITFENRTRADHVMESWVGGRPSGLVIWPVVPDVVADSSSWSGDAYASAAACVAAGLEAWDPEAKPAA